MINGTRNVLGPTIKFYRKKLGISQEYLTARLNVLGINIDQTILSRIENQEREIYDYEIYAIAEALEIDLIDLLKKDKII